MRSRSMYLQLREKGEEQSEKTRLGQFSYALCTLCMYDISLSSKRLAARKT